MSIGLQQPPHPHEGYSSLWEIQLELGEIPDMISNNLLTPCDEHPPHSEGDLFYFGCSPSSRPTLNDLVDERGGIDRVAKTCYDQLEEEEEVKERREDSIQSNPLALVGLLSSLSYTPFKDLMEESSTGGHLRLSSLDEQEYGDSDYEEDFERKEEEDEETLMDDDVGGDEDDEDASDEKEGSWVLSHPLNHPIYGMPGTIGDEEDDPEIDQVGNELFKHDRKDSGVFLQQEKDSFLVTQPLDILRLLAVVQTADDQWQ
ncbi:hypothetical protein EMPS_10199 [Entomortierella parvispora]|uniref:Uncharacterized protein n=1 Tax=Entomortierella parvispora TaxID=205924 RepID=A0A9P3HJQ6_9FUNG|nr:hypothetical protein EMPS_10199 [Entomortierella parvispora]